MASSSVMPATESSTGGSVVYDGVNMSNNNNGGRGSSSSSSSIGYNGSSSGISNDMSSGFGTFNELFERFSKPPSPPTPTPAAAAPPTNGGQTYPCGTGAAAAAWCNNDKARAGFNMHPRSFYPAPWAGQAGAAMKYDHYTGASFDLYPDIVKKYRVVIYNGDVDACVPYNSNEDWTVALAAQQKWPVAEAWRPWLLDNIPAGYVTTYKLSDDDTPAAGGGSSSNNNFTFITIKESGHMVPQYQPARALAFFERWLKGGPY